MKAITIKGDVVEITEDFIKGLIDHSFDLCSKVSCFRCDDEKCVGRNHSRHVFNIDETIRILNMVKKGQ